MIGFHFGSVREAMVVLSCRLKPSPSGLNANCELRVRRSKDLGGSDNYDSTVIRPRYDHFPNLQLNDKSSLKLSSAICIVLRENRSFKLLFETSLNPKSGLKPMLGLTGYWRQRAGERLGNLPSTLLEIRLEDPR